MVCMLIIILILYCWYEQCSIENEEAADNSGRTEESERKSRNSAA